MPRETMRMQCHLKSQDRRPQVKAIWTERRLNEKSCETRRIQEKWCQEKTVSKEWGAERRECQEKKPSRKEMPKDRDARMPRERDVNGKQLKRHQCQEPAMKSEQYCQERRVCQVSGSIQGCQEEGLSRFRDVEGKPGEEKVALSDKMWREEMSSRKVNGRDNQAVRRCCSYRLSLFSKGSPLFETSVTQLARALLVFMRFLYNICVCFFCLFYYVLLAFVLRTHSSR